MRLFAVLCVVLLCAFRAEAQPLWTELTSNEQAAVIMSRRTPEVVRSVMLSETELKALDAETHQKLLDRITSRCTDEHLAALYLYIYNALREPNGTMAAYDVRMLAMHAPLMFKAWRDTEDYDNLYNWAYSLGAHAARYGHKAVKRALKTVASKSIVSDYGALVNRFSTAYNIAQSSVSIGLNSHNDITPPATLSETFTFESKELYDAVNTTCKPIVEPKRSADSEVESAMRRECIMWDGAYNTAIKHSHGRNLSIVCSLLADGEYLTFIDANNDAYTLENEVFILDSGYFVAICRQASPNGIIIGRLLSRGGFVLFGERSLDYGTEIRDVKCEGSSIHLCVDVEGIGERYLNYTIR